MADTNTVTTQELFDAGASAAFVKYYETAKEAGKRTAAVGHVESEFRTVEEVGENPGAGGSFFESLWLDDPRFPHSDNPYGADGTNYRLLEQAGVYPLKA